MKQPIQVEQLNEHIKETCKKLDTLYNIEPKTKGIHIWIDYLEKILVDIDKIKRQLENKK